MPANTVSGKINEGMKILTYEDAHRILMMKLTLKGYVIADFIELRVDSKEYIEVAGSLFGKLIAVTWKYTASVKEIQ